MRTCHHITRPAPCLSALSCPPTPPPPPHLPPSPCCHLPLLLSCHPTVTPLCDHPPPSPPVTLLSPLPQTPCHPSLKLPIILPQAPCHPPVTALLPFLSPLCPCCHPFCCPPVSPLLPSCPPPVAVPCKGAPASTLLRLFDVPLSRKTQYSVREKKKKKHLKKPPQDVHMPSRATHGAKYQT